MKTGEYILRNMFAIMEIRSADGEALSLPVGTHRSDDDDVAQAEERLVVQVGELDLCRTARPVAVVVE